MGVSEKDRCRPLTHHCYTISEPGWKTSLCCPKPCRDPTPLYINNQCLSIAHREDPCQLHQQVFFFSLITLTYRSFHLLLRQIKFVLINYKYLKDTFYSK